MGGVGVPVSSVDGRVPGVGLEAKGAEGLGVPGSPPLWRLAVGADLDGERGMLKW